MWTRSNFSLTVLSCLLTAALTLILSISISAESKSTTLTATVPETAKLSLELSGQGTVRINGVEHTKSKTIELPRNGTIKIEIKPNAGNKIQEVVFNGEDYTDKAKTDMLVLNTTGETISLTVRFEKASSTPQTGDSGLMLIFSTSVIILLIAMCKALSPRRNHTN